MAKKLLNCIFQKIFDLKTPMPQMAGEGGGLGGTVEVPEGKPAPTEGEEAPEAEEDWQTGKKEEYLEFVKSNADYVLTTAIKISREKGERPSFENYAQEWLKNTKKAAAEIRASWPKKKGLKDFVEGLEKNQFLNKEETIVDPDYNSSYEMLESIIKYMKERDSQLHLARANREKLVQKEGAVTDTLKAGVSNLVQKFHEGSATEKILILAAVGVVAKTAVWLYKQKIPGTEKTKFGSLINLGIVAWAINEGVRLGSKDGRDLMQKINLGGTTVDDVRGSMWGLFALEGEKEKRQLLAPNEHKTMFAFATKDMRPIAEMYEKYTTQNRKEFSKNDLEYMGISAEEAAKMDGAIAFKVVDKLFRMAGRNYYMALRVKTARERGCKPEDIKLEEFGKSFEELGHVAIEQKYLSGETGSRKWTFEEVMVEELMEEASVVGGVEELEKLRYGPYDEKKLEKRTAKAAAVIGSAAAEKISEYAGRAKRGLWKISGKIGDAFKDLYDKAEKEFEEMMGKHKEDEIAIQNVLLKSPENIRIVVTAPGKVTVNGYPTLYAKAEEGKKVSYTIEGVTLSPDITDQKVRDAASADLAKAIRKKAVDAAKSATLDNKGKLDFDKLQWDPGRGIWYLPGIKVNGLAAVGLPSKTADLTLHFDDDGRASFELAGEKIADMKEADKSYHYGEIIKGIRKEYPFLDEIAPGLKADSKLNITISGLLVKPELSGKFVHGEIAGQPFALLCQYNDANKKWTQVEFFDPDSPSGSLAKGLDQVPIGPDFARAKVEQIGRSTAFHKVFEDLNNVVATTSSIDSEDKTKFRYLLAFKRDEMLALFKENLKDDADLDEAETTQDDYISTILTNLRSDLRAFQALPATAPSGQNDQKKEFPKLYANMRDLNYANADVNYRTVYNNLLADVLNTGRYKLGSRVIKAAGKVPYVERADDQEVLNIIRNVWSNSTRELLKSSLTPQEVNELEDVRRKILLKLDDAMQKGIEPGVVTTGDLEGWNKV